MLPLLEAAVPSRRGQVATQAPGTCIERDSATQEEVRGAEMKRIRAAPRRLRCPRPAPPRARGPGARAPRHTVPCLLACQQTARRACASRPAIARVAAVLDLLREAGPHRAAQARLHTPFRARSREARGRELGDERPVCARTSSFSTPGSVIFKLHFFFCTLVVSEFIMICVFS